MAIIAQKGSGTKERKTIPAGNHVARCYGMIEIGTITEIILGESKTMHKVMIDWELPNEKAIFSEEKGEQPFVFSKEFTLSMHEKASLRAILTSWRGKQFSDAEASNFDITKLIGVPCMLNIVHKASKDGLKVYANLAGVTPLPKGFNCPDAITPQRILSFDNWSQETFMTLPDWLADKISGSAQYKAKFAMPNEMPQLDVIKSDVNDPLPF